MSVYYCVPQCVYVFTQVFVLNVHVWKFNIILRRWDTLRGTLQGDVWVCEWIKPSTSTLQLVCTICASSDLIPQLDTVVLLFISVRVCSGVYVCVSVFVCTRLLKFSHVVHDQEVWGVNCNPILENMSKNLHLPDKNYHCFHFQVRVCDIYACACVHTYTYTRIQI